jgi:hypothetical protein
MKNKLNYFIIIIILFTIILFSFLYGMQSYRSSNFLYKVVSKIYQKYNPNSNFKTILIPDLEKFENIDFINEQKRYAEDIFNEIRKNTLDFRNNIIKKIVLPNEKIKLDFDLKSETFFLNKDIKKESNSIIIKSKFYGIESYGILEKNNNNKLFIFHGGQGYSRIPLQYNKFLPLKEELKKNGYDILSLSIAGIGYNVTDEYISFPTNPNLSRKGLVKKSYETKIFEKTSQLRHIFLDYFDTNYPEIDPLALLTTGNYSIIKSIENDYETISIAGLSGGGFMTTLLSAIIPKIDNSFNFSGSIPKSYFPPRWNPHDLMQGESNFWKKYSIWHFFFLSILDNKNFVNRNHHLVYGEKDCCFYPPYSTSFDKLLKELDIKGLNAEVINNLTHDIDIEYISKNIIQK